MIEYAVRKCAPCFAIPFDASVTIVTSPLALLLSTCALLAAPDAPPSPTARAEATLQRVVKLPQEHQQAWLRVIEQRYSWSVMLTLKPDDAQREQARVATILRQKTVAWGELVKLLQQLDKREKAATSHMLRIYRSTVYDNFHKRPKEMIDRNEAWFRVWSAWEKAGSPPEQQDRLMDWLAEAIKTSSTDTLAPLPEDPKFGPDVELVSAAVVKQLRDAREKERVAASPPPAQERREEYVPRPELRLSEPLAVRIPDPDWNVARDEQTQSQRFFRRNASALPAVVLAFEVELPRMKDWNEPLSDDPPDVAATLTRRYALTMTLDCKVHDSGDFAGEATATIDGEGTKPQAISSTRSEAVLPEKHAMINAIEPTVAEIRPMTIAPHAISSQDPAIAEPESRHIASLRSDVVAMLPHTLVLPHAIAPGNAAPTYQVERRPIEVETLPQPSPSSDPPADDAHAHVRVDELRTRIEGINLALRTLEGELNEKHEFTADQLDSLLSRLDILVLRQKDLALFRDLVSAQEQAKLGGIDSSRTAVATLGTRIAELRTRTRSNESLSQADRDAALKQLDELSDRLATLTAEK